MKRGEGSSLYAPTNEGRGGTIKYLNNGIQSVRSSRRQAAYKMMHKYCSGPYRIISESQNKEGGAGFTTLAPGGAITSYGSSDYQYLTFECGE